MEKRYKSVVCVDLIIKKIINNETNILLMKRQNTGSDDGNYELPGGHLEKDEDLVDATIREAKEELGITLNRKDLKIVQVFHHYTGERINFIFETKKEAINPIIGEPDKCSEIKWFKIDNLPDDTTYKVKTIIDNFIKNKKYDIM